MINDTNQMDQYGFVSCEAMQLDASCSCFHSRLAKTNFWLRACTHYNCLSPSDLHLHLNCLVKMNFCIFYVFGCRCTLYPHPDTLYPWSAFVGIVAVVVSFELRTVGILCHFAMSRKRCHV